METNLHTALSQSVC